MISLDSVTKHKHLRVTINNKLNWSPHCNTIAMNANRSMGILHRHLNGCSASVKSTAYKVLVQPQMKYCFSVWYPYKKLDKAALERVQRRAAKFVTGDYKMNCSVTSMIKT